MPALKQFGSTIGSDGQHRMMWSGLTWSVVHQASLFIWYSINRKFVVWVSTLVHTCIDEIVSIGPIHLGTDEQKTSIGFSYVLVFLLLYPFYAESNVFRRWWTVEKAFQSDSSNRAPNDASESETQTNGTAVSSPDQQRQSTPGACIGSMRAPDWASFAQPVLVEFV